MFLLGILLPLAGNIVPGNHMAVTAVGFHQLVTNVNRMNKVSDPFTERYILLSLIKNIVADFAVFGNYFAVGCLMFVVMAAETSGGVEVTDVVRIGAPFNLHGREEVPLENIIHTIHCLLDCRGLLLSNFRIVGDIVGRNVSINCGETFLFGLLGSIKNFNRHLLDERE